MTATVLVAGRGGQVARALAGVPSPDLAFVCVGRSELDLARTREIAGGIDALVERLRPAAIVNAAGYTAVDEAETERHAAMALNRDAAGSLAAAAARHGLPFVHLSTDYVFSGDKGSPYVEGDDTGPLGIYGRTKLEGELAVAGAGGRSAILRTSWVFGAHGGNFLTTMLRLASERDRLRVVADQWGTPTFAPDLALAVATVLRDLIGTAIPGGLFHVAGSGSASRADLADEIVRQSARQGGPSARVERISAADHPAPARRPADSRLSTAAFEARFGCRLPPWQDGVARCLQALLR